MSAFFQISGDFLTNHCRGLMLEGEFRKASNTLKDGLIGIDYETVVSILNGDKKLVGVNDLDLVDECPEVRAEYLSDLDYIVHRCYWDNKRQSFFVPYAEVTSWGLADTRLDADARIASSILSGGDFEDNLRRYEIHVDSPVESSSRFQCKRQAKVARSMHYRHSGNDVVYQHGKRHILCEPVPGHTIPFWMNEKDFTFEKALERNSLHETGFASVYHEYEESLNAKVDDTLKRAQSIVASMPTQKTEEEWEEEDRKMEEQYNLLKEKIITQTDEWIEIIDCHSGEKFGSVPKAPFVHWACRNIPVGDNVLPVWETVSPTGMKLYMDNPNHTDWMIGGGFDLEKDYSQSKVQDAAYSMIEDIQEEYLKMDIPVLTQGQIVKGRIVHVLKESDHSKVKFGDIIVIPNASVDFSLAFSKATHRGTGGVICVQGNKVAHICKIARERDVTVMMDTDAFSKYTDERTYVELDPRPGKGTIRVLDIYEIPTVREKAFDLSKLP